jgi:magnesium transporter
MSSPKETHMRNLAEVFDIHPLIVEDAVTGGQRPKYEHYGQQELLVLRTLLYDHSGQRPHVETGEVLLIFGEQFLISVNHGSPATLPDIDSRLDSDLDRFFSPRSLLYAMADDIVDNYLRISEALEDDVTALEDAVFAPDGNFSIQDVYMQMREVVTIRHVVDPLTPSLKESVSSAPADHDLSYMRDVLDHQIQASGRIEGYANRLSGLVDSAAARISLRQNTDMRKISAWAGVIAVPTVFTGFYGMNFVHMPELDTNWGYPAVVAAIVVSVIILIVIFRRNHWL